MSRRSGLGRGLGALIPQAGSAPTGSDLVQLPLGQVRANRLQPRKQFDEEALAALVDSIKAVGLLQPVLVRELAPGDYELIAGERRLRAARRAGLTSIPAVIRAVDDVSSLEQALVENLQREDLNVLDEAAAYQQLIEDFELTHDEVARRVGKSRTSVTNALRLFQLPPVVQRHVRDGLLTAGHARAVLGSPDRALQESVANDAIRQGLSVRAVEEIIRAAVRADQADQADSADQAAQADQTATTTGDEELSEIQPAEPGAAAAGPGRRLPDVRRAEAPSPGAGPTGAPITRLRPPGVLDLEELLGNYLNTRVAVDMGGKRGRLVVEFATLDDLERIYRLITGDDRPQD
ncbi:MAG: ParB/RepB/Spo0J family partition protein [Acidimicrobiales bacterium]